MNLTKSDKIDFIKSFILKNDCRYDDDLIEKDIIDMAYELFKFNIIDKILIQNPILARYYGTYCIIKKDYIKAFELYQKAVDLGNDNAINSLAICYERGFGIEKDIKKAFELYQKGADLNNGAATNNLGCCYEYGTGTEPNIQKAFELYPPTLVWLAWRSAM